jgi:hypothetical protein
MRTEKILRVWRSGAGHIVVGAAMATAVMLPVVALAQPAPEPKATTPPEVMAPPGENPAPTPDPSTGGDKPKEPLSKELKDGEGVIEPPRGASPDIVKPPPEDFESRTPVIPPPGEPGGNPDVQPK